MSIDVSVVVPTYREAENLPLLVPRVMAALAEAGLEGEIVVVDDDSRDGTEEACARLAEEHPVRLIVRKDERGLSSAVILGMREAGGEILVVMDADLSHPPEKVPELVDAIRSRHAAFSLGSRYVPGGGTEEGWGFLRWLNSKVATWLALPLVSCRDPMAGFFAIRRSTFEAARDLDPIGYKIGLELMVKCGVREVDEVPIAFAKRVHGTSKLSLREQVDYLRHLGRLYLFRLGPLARPAQFLAVGATGMVIDLTAFRLLDAAAVPVEIARALAIWTAMTWNFFLNRRFTFSDARRDSPLRQYLLFCGSCLIGALVSWTISVSLIRGTPYFGRHPIRAAIIGIVGGTVSNYILALKVAFRRR